MSQYWIKIDEAVEGPFEGRVLRFVEGFTRDTLVSHDEMPEESWLRAIDIDELKALFLKEDPSPRSFTAAPPAPPPPPPPPAPSYDTYPPAAEPVSPYGDTPEQYAQTLADQYAPAEPLEPQQEAPAYEEPAPPAPNYPLPDNESIADPAASRNVLSVPFINEVPKPMPGITEIHSPLASDSVSIDVGEYAKKFAWILLAAGLAFGAYWGYKHVPLSPVKNFIQEKLTRKEKPAEPVKETAPAKSSVAPAKKAAAATAEVKTIPISVEKPKAKTKAKPKRKLTPLEEKLQDSGSLFPPVAAPTPKKVTPEPVEPQPIEQSEPEPAPIKKPATEVEEDLKYQKFLLPGVPAPNVGKKAE